MVDFSSRIKAKAAEKKINPLELYESLDRASDKGPLRPAQEAILSEWFSKHKAKKDAIIKLHTGQGKTLIGLLILQAKINEKAGPAIYLCPNKYLVKQTCIQAKQFGLTYCEIDSEFPDEFIDGKSILITHVHKLFNGLSKFKTGVKSQKISYLAMDDAHACIDIIKKAFTINIKSTEQAYLDLLGLFNSELEFQGAGTFAEIKLKDYDAFLGVPYWDWQDKHLEITQILSKYLDKDYIRFAWPLIRDTIKDCQCVISGEHLEIFPHVSPLSLFESFTKAEHRVFMSATFADDAFLIKGIGIDPDAVKQPLVYKKEKWSGEKMIILPSIIDASLDRSTVVNLLGPKKPKTYGIVVLATSFKSCKDWETCGATIANADSIEEEIEKFKSKDFQSVLVIVNRYDGIDLPDQACRVLVIDSKPFFEDLSDRYFEACRGKSEVVSKRGAQIIEQGLGRGVRGEKDYCAIILIGPELTNAVRSNESRKYFSDQTRAQIEIGIEVSQFGKEDLQSGGDPEKVLTDLVNKLLRRDESWKEFYIEKMDSVVLDTTESIIFNLFEAEKIADQYYVSGDAQKCAEVFQKIIDTEKLTQEDKGWYLQEMARVLYPLSKVDSNKLQIEAHRVNRFLFKPKEGMKVVKLPLTNQKRNRNIIDWVSRFPSYQELQLGLDEILTSLAFGVKADKFERAVDNLAKCIGFESQRPDKEWKEGPDNLWVIRDNEYLLIQCKNCVDLNRAEINKDESGQLNNAYAWFSKHYKGAHLKSLMIIPTLKLGSAAGFNCSVEIVREKNLKKLVRNVRSFFMEFRALDFQGLSEEQIQKFLDAHGLSIDNIKSEYSEIPKQ